MAACGIEWLAGGHKCGGREAQVISEVFIFLFL